MKQWSFEKQVRICLMILLGGFCLAAFTKLGIFSNLAWIASGMLFVVHPVVPGSAEEKKKPYVRIAGIICILVGVAARFVM